MMPREIDQELDSGHYQDNEQESVDTSRSLLGQCGFDPHVPVPHDNFDWYDLTLQHSPEAQREAEWLVKAVSSWSAQEEGTPSWLLIAGATGTGKTQLLKTAVWSQKLRGVWPRYITAYMFDRQVKDFQNSLSKNSNAPAKDIDVWVEELASVSGGLVIDDVGAGYIDKGWTKTRFERLFDIRYERRLPTAIATNLTGEGFLAVVGERVYSRVRDTSLGQILNLKYCQDVRSNLSNRS
jgi:DNA replication protein DnaC